MKNQKKKNLRVFLILSLLLFVSFLAGLGIGSVHLSLTDIFESLAGKNTAGNIIVLKLRLPRVLGALLSGAALSVSGLLLQSVTDNDLASPNVVGVNAGAGMAVMLILCFLPQAYTALPAAAFAGGVTAVILVLLISETAQAHRRKTTMILAGVAVSAMFNAGISFLSQMVPDAVSSYVYFSTGGFNGVYMKDLAVPGIVILMGVAVSLMLAPRLNLLCLGDDMASSLGVRVKTLRIVSLLLASLLCGASVSYAGLLGFVGLIVPHIGRRIIGSDLKILMPASCLMGGILVILADLIGRTAFAPSEVSAGVFLSILGAPFFVFLLYRRRRT